MGTGPRRNYFFSLGGSGRLGLLPSVPVFFGGSLLQPMVPMARKAANTDNETSLVMGCVLYSGVGGGQADAHVAGSAQNSSMR
jgi:hypothetical protein